MYICHVCWQIKKCGEEDCGYCRMNPPRLPPADFDELCFLPDPVLNEAREYKDLAEVYGTDTSDSDRPGLAHTPQPTDADKENKKYFVAGGCYQSIHLYEY